MSLHCLFCGCGTNEWFSLIYLFDKFDIYNVRGEDLNSKYLH